MNEAPRGYPMPPQQQQPTPGLNGFAVASLVCGVVGLGAAFGVVFGVVAIAQITRRGGRGLGLAIAGICLSTLWGVALTLVLTFVVSDYLSSSMSTTPDVSPSEAAADAPDSAPPMAPARVAKGECILRLDPDLRVEDMTKIACHKPHEAEVYLVFDLKLWPYPGDPKVDAAAENRCRREFPGYGFGQFSNGEMFYEFPAESVYDQSRWVTCVAYAGTGTWTGQLPS
ncbi:DUF4190 domain-containing protein [Actinoplanes sp. NPDC049668]|uniref:DUF4190 domain-containing protein n=1 Tax=unclassified Actinoplanes TaxID=2626549 RepID=UPI0033BE1210